MFDATGVEIRALSDLAQRGQLGAGKDGRLVGLADELDAAFELVEKARALLVDFVHLPLRAILRQREDDFEGLPQIAHFRFFADVVEAIHDAREVERVQLLRFNQDVFADSHFSKVVEQSGVAQFISLCGGKMNCATPLCSTTLEKWESA